MKKLAIDAARQVASMLILSPAIACWALARLGEGLTALADWIAVNRAWSSWLLAQAERVAGRK